MNWKSVRDVDTYQLNVFGDLLLLSNTFFKFKTDTAVFGGWSLGRIECESFSIERS